MKKESKSNRTSDAEFFHGASPEIFERGRTLRKEMTTAEKILWNKLRRKKIKGLRFRRQHQISRFVVDFYCHEKRFVIELDGEVHNSNESKEKDQSRAEALKSFGLRVIRFKNEEVISELYKVIKTIEELV